MYELPRIACYGYVKKNSGSLGQANFLILEEMLKRGYQIDFYVWKDFNEPKELLKYSNLKFHIIPDNSLVRRIIEILPKTPRELANKLIYPIIYNFFIYYTDNQLLKNEIQKKHDRVNYDLLIFLGLFAPFEFGKLPVISWIQGIPQAEWNFIKKLKDTLISLCGFPLYLQLKIYYLLKIYRFKKELKNSDVFIWTSEWSKEQLAKCGVDPQYIKVLPYPIDLELFSFNSSSEGQFYSTDKILLWLGRIDPRKRLDLLLDAFSLILRERQDIKLKIIGRFGYAKGYRKLIDNFEFSEFIEYRPQVDQVEVAKLLSQSDILVQPSEGENFGSSVAEALCTGLPVIVGPTNGTKDFISASPACFIFDEYDPQFLKETILEAVQAVEKDRENLALEARRIAEDSFRTTKIVDSFVEVINEVIAKGKK